MKITDSKPEIFFQSPAAILFLASVDFWRCCHSKLVLLFFGLFSKLSFEKSFPQIKLNAFIFMKTEDDKFLVHYKQP